jgi:hypothetical protein
MCAYSAGAGRARAVIALFIRRRCGLCLFTPLQLILNKLCFLMARQNQLAHNGPLLTPDTMRIPKVIMLETARAKILEAFKFVQLEIDPTYK